LLGKIARNARIDLSKNVLSERTGQMLDGTIP
jgi:hypothetical protein